MRSPADVLTDPRPGDVVKLAPFDKERVVKDCRFRATCDGVGLCVSFEDGSYTTLKYGMANAEVLHVAE
jgi:hypothetical protein